MSKDRAGARSKAGDGKREDVNRADLPNRYEQQGRCFFFVFFSQPCCCKNERAVFFKKNISNGGWEAWMERGREVEGVG